MIHVSPSRGVPSISPQKGKKKTEKLRLQAPTSLPSSAPNPRPSASPAMSGLRAISTLLHTCAAAAAGGSSRRVALAPPLGRSFRVPWRAPSAFVFDEVARAAGGERRRVSTRAASWDSEKSPYETLGMMTLLPPLLVRASGYAVGIRIGTWGFCCVEVWNIIDFVITAFDTMELQW